MSNKTSLKDSDFVANAQRQALIAVAPRSLVFSIVAATLCFCLLRTEVDEAQLRLWFLANLAITAIRAATLAYIRQSKDKSHQRLSKQVNLLTFTIGMSGLSWGTLALLWTPALPVVTQLQILLFPATLAAGAVATYGVWLKAYMLFMLACILPVTAGFLLVDNGLHYGTAALTVLYMLPLFVLCKSYQKSITDSIKLRFENSTLIDSLSAQNKELIEAKNTAEAARKSKSEFMACVSHEMRTPLNGVLGVTELLMSTELSLQQQKLTSTIYQSGKSLLSKINDTLHFSKNNARDIKIENTAFNLKESVHLLGELLRQNAATNNNTLSVKFNSEVPEMVIGDAARVQQILINLVSNAIKFTRNGEITLEVNHRFEDTDFDQIEFIVRDTGIGIAADKLECIFEPFSQADSSTTREYGGIGLGLSIVRQLLDALNGEIAVSSEQGVGSCFITLLPLQKYTGATMKNISSNSQPEQQTDNTDTSLNGLHILVAEDCEVNQMVIQSMLEQLGCTVCIVDNGKQAVEAAKNNNFELILMDCQMPVMDGYTATQLIRKAEPGGNARTPILAVTANCLPGDQQRCYDCGMDDFMSKPFEQQQLTEMLLHNLPTQRKNAA